MIPNIDALVGNWVSRDKHPQHLQTKGFTVKFNLDILPFNNHAIAKIITVDEDKKDRIQYTGEVKIDDGFEDEFFIVIGDLRIPASELTDESFKADITLPNVDVDNKTNYGLVTFTKH